jgi:Abortive infection alpha
MLFSKEREKVASATRAIRAMVIRPRADGATETDLGGGLQVMMRLAMSPLGFVPQAAARVPNLLRELGERRRAIPERRRLAPNPMLAAQVLSGYLRADETLRERYLNLLAASMDSATARSVHPAFLAVLRQITPDEARIFSLFDADGPYPVLTVQARQKFGGFTHAELRNFSLLGEQAGCDFPDRAPMYLDNLIRLGLIEIRAARLSEDARMFKAVEQHPRVTEAIARIEARRPSQLGPSDDPIVPDIQHKYLFVTAFGRQFYDACEYRPEAES